MNEVIQRVIDERDELKDRLVRLTEFIGGTGFESVSDNQAGLLLAQAEAMRNYLQILALRARDFREQEAE